MPIIRPHRIAVYGPNGDRIDKDKYESYSSMSRYLQCPANYYDRYERKVYDASTPPLIFGQAYHSALEHWLTEKMHTGVEIGPARMRELFQLYWIIEFEAASGTQGFIWDDAHSPEWYMKRGLALIARWVEEIGHPASPRAVEVPFWLTFSGCRKMLYGKIDYIDDDGSVIDHKTAVTQWVKVGKQYQQKNIDQTAGIYEAGYWQLYGKWPVASYLHRALMSGPVRIEVIPITKSMAEVQEYINTTIKPTLVAIQEAWNLGNFPCICKGKHIGHDPNQPTTQPTTQTPA